MSSCFLASTSKKHKSFHNFWLNYIEECSTLSFSANNGKVFVFLVKLYSGVFHLIQFQQIMEKCLYFWLNYIVECSTLLFSANNGKVFVFLVRLYRGVFHLIVFSK